MASLWQPCRQLTRCHTIGRPVRHCLAPGHNETCVCHSATLPTCCCRLLLSVGMPISLSFSSNLALAVCKEQPDRRRSPHYNELSLVVHSAFARFATLLGEPTSTPPFSLRHVDRSSLVLSSPLSLLLLLLRIMQTSMTNHCGSNYHRPLPPPTHSPVPAVFPLLPLPMT